MTTTNSKEADDEWRTELVSADGEGCQFYLEQYKPFRLGALQRDPDAFGSTYAREIAFADEDWLRRVRNPLAKTFVAVRRRDGAILSSATLMGPLPLQRTEPASLIIHEDNGTSNSQGKSPEDDDDDDDAPLSYEIAGVYTRPEARGRGLGGALMSAAVERAAGEAGRRRGRRLELKTIVYASNTGAAAFYEKCGFVVAGSPRGSVKPSKGPEPVTELDMYYRAAP